MREVQGQAKTVRELLKGNRYSIDYYQREYKWETKQIVELIDDLTEAFLESYEQGDPRKKVRDYGRYFLGSIILSQRDGAVYIVDGQQRLSSLTLLLIYLRNQQRDRDDAVNVDELIFSTQFGEKAFNLNVDERMACLNALFEDVPFEDGGQSESVQNLLARYRDIEAHFPLERVTDDDEATAGVESAIEHALPQESLPYFVDWLIENVHLVEITAFSDEDAYTIFETMNDRGLSLSPSDMLKGYLLANINDPTQRAVANDKWKKHILALDEHGKETSSDFLKSWLRSQYAHKIRERKQGSRPEDFDRIGTEFHRWVNQNSKQISLVASDDFVRFINRDMDFYSRQYLKILQMSESYSPGTDRVHYNARFGFTLQNVLLLAPLRTTDSDSVIALKLRIVSLYIDTLLVLRQWNYKSVSYSAMQYAVFLTMRDIRDKSDPEDLARMLHRTLCQEPWKFSGEERLRLHQRNGWFIRNLLARITDYVETQSGNASKFAEIMAEKTPNRYEIEHIWSSMHDEHEDEFPYRGAFMDYRNHIGGLLLLPKKFNASFGKLPYEQKLPHYNSQNVLVRSLNPEAYSHNPGFMQFLERSGLPFKPHHQFKQADMDDRQALYGLIAQKIWNPDLLLEEIEG